MWEINGTTIRLTRGDSFYCLITLTVNDEPYTPQEGDAIRFALKHARMNVKGTEYADPLPVLRKTIPTDNLLLHIAPEDTKGLGFGNYKYDIEITFSNKDTVTFIEDADFILKPEVD